MIFGIGIDVLEIDRITKIIENNERFLTKILGENELALCPANKKRKSEFVAGRFAAKEAVAKALGTGIGQSLSWKDIEVLKEETGKPYVLLKNEKWKEKNFKIHLSISHTRELVFAKVIVEY